MAFSDFDNFGNHFSGYPNVNVDGTHTMNDAIGHGDIIIKMGAVLNDLSIQFGPVGQLASIHIDVFNGWSPAEKTTLENLMM